MVETQADASKSPAQDMDDDDVEDFSPIRGDESPPHLQAKTVFFCIFVSPACPRRIACCLPF